MSSIFQKDIMNSFEIPSPRQTRQQNLPHRCSTVSTRTWQASHKFTSSVEREKGSLIGSLGNHPITYVELRAEIVAGCQGKCREMFAWRESWIPVGEQGEPCSPTRWHIKPNVSADFSAGFKICHISHRWGWVIKPNNLNVPERPIWTACEWPLSLLSFLRDSYVRPAARFGFFLWVFLG